MKLTNITITTKRNTRNISYNGKWYAEAKQNKSFIIAGNGDTEKEAIKHVETQLKALGYK